MQKETTTLWIAVTLAVGVVAALWYYSTTLQPRDEPQPTAPVEQQSPAQTPVTEGGPQYPLEDADDAVAQPLHPLPDLNDSDEYFKLELAYVFSPDLTSLLADSRLIERLVATIDNLPRSHMAEQTRPIAGTAGRIVVDTTGQAGAFVLNADNYRRYDTLVQMFAAADPSLVAGLYRRFYPLLQDAYVDLGYPNGYFNDRLIEVIDHLLETPEPEQPLQLVQTHVLYQFADPQLEQRSSGQKTLLRMGPDHARTIKNRLTELRELIASQGPE